MGEPAPSVSAFWSGALGGFALFGAFFSVLVLGKTFGMDKLSALFKTANTTILSPLSFFVFLSFVQSTTKTKKKKITNEGTKLQDDGGFCVVGCWRPAWLVNDIQFVLFFSAAAWQI